jgi:hypothetical protein
VHAGRLIGEKCRSNFWFYRFLSSTFWNYRREDAAALVRFTLSAPAELAEELKYFQLKEDDSKVFSCDLL